MSIFAQRLSRLRCTYSTLLRLCDNHNYLQRTSALSERKLGTFTRSSVRVTFRETCGTRSVISAAHRDMDSDDTATVIERMKENEYAHNLFLSSINYTKSMMPQSTTYAYVTNEEALQILQQNWNQMKDEEILFAIKKLSYNVRYSNERIEPMKYKSTFDALSVRYQNLSNENLLMMMRYLVPFRAILAHYPFYDNFCIQLDEKCVACFTQLPVNDMLALCDMLYQLIRKNSTYIWYAMRKLGNKPQKLSPQHLVQVLFFLNIFRKPPINMYELEYRLEQCLDELSINELGIAALGFFKTKTKIRNADLLNRFITKTTANIEAADNISIGAITKLVRYSMQLTEINPLKELINAIMPQTSRFTLTTLTHIAHACARVALYDKEFMDIVIKRLNSEIKDARLKDFERLVFIFVSFNIDSSNSVYQNVIEELRTTWDTSRAPEIAQFPYVVVRILGSMSYVNIYPIDLIQRIMQPEHIHKTCSGNYHFLSQQYCTLNYSLRLEVPEYDGPFLRPDVCSYIAKKFFTEHKTAKLNRTNVLLTSVLQTCQEMFDNTSDIIVDRPLPHYITQDIVLCLDERNRLMPSKEFLSSFTVEEIKRVDKENAKNARWFALVLAPQALLIRGTDRYVGLLATRIRQLSVIGYTPIVISVLDWKELRTKQERFDHIKKLIFINNTPELTNT